MRSGLDERLNNEVFGVVDEVRRAWRKLKRCGSDGVDAKFSRGLADCVEVVAVVPINLVHGVCSKQTGIVRNGI